MDLALHPQPPLRQLQAAAPICLKTLLLATILAGINHLPKLKVVHKPNRATMAKAVISNLLHLHSRVVISSHLHRNKAMAAVRILHLHLPRPVVAPILPMDHHLSSTAPVFILPSNRHTRLRPSNKMRILLLRSHLTRHLLNNTTPMSIRHNRAILHRRSQAILLSHRHLAITADIHLSLRKVAFLLPATLLHLQAEASTHHSNRDNKRCRCLAWTTVNKVATHPLLAIPPTRSNRLVW